MHGTNYCEFTEQMKQKDFQHCSFITTHNPTLYIIYMAKRLCGIKLHPYARLLKQIALIMIKIIAPLITLEYKINCWQSYW
jgi:hypothetical protein